MCTFPESSVYSGQTGFFEIYIFPPESSVCPIHGGVFVTLQLTSVFWYEMVGYSVVFNESNERKQETKTQQSKVEEWLGRMKRYSTT
jgi:hypothetical protein